MTGPAASEQGASGQATGQAAPGHAAGAARAEHGRAPGERAPGAGPAARLGVPRVIIAAAALGAVFVVLPIASMAWRVDWAQFIPLVTAPASLDALWLSLRTSLIATALCLVLGVPMAIVLARVEFPGKRIARALVMVPLVLPPVVGGIALLSAFGRQGLLGRSLEVLGVLIAFSTTAVVIAQTFVALPFLVLSLEGALRTAGTRYEAVAATLGAGPGTVFRRVTVPLVLPAVVSGAVLSFARALGEFGATLTFAGSLQGTTRTLPLEIYLQRETDPDAAVALSLVLVVVAVVVVSFTHGVGRRPTLGRSAQRRHTAPPAAGTAATSASAAPVSAPSVSAPPATDAPTTDARAAAQHPARRRPPERFAMRAIVRERDVDAELEVAAGETVALLGPNGAGKSTLLGLASGLLAADSGRAVLGDRVLFDIGDGGRRQSRRPHERGVALLAQDALLFPNLTARDNVAFGPRSLGVARREARRIADDWLSRVGATGLADRKPAELSGGQAQRIAVARALAADPELLLLDEPMAALDASVVPALRRLLRDTLAGRTTIIVTHDPLDAVTLADRVALIEGGRVVDAGRTRDVLERPTTPFAARLAGVNLLVGTLEDDTAWHEHHTVRTVRTDDGTRVRVAPTGNLEGLTAGARVGVAIRPSRVWVATAAPVAERGTGIRAHGSPADGSPANVIDAVVTDLEPRDDSIRVRAGAIAADVAPGVVADLDLQAGALARFTFGANEATAYPV